MLKKIWMPFLALAIIGCSSDTKEINTVEESSELSVKSSTKMTLQDFAYIHCTLTNEIIHIWEAEIDAKREVNEVAIEQIHNASSESEYQAILESNGVEKTNAAKIIELVTKQVDNFNAFVAQNPEFGKLNEESQQDIISGAIKEMITLNPDNLFPVDNYEPNVHPCDRNKRIGLRDCFEDAAYTMGVGLVGGIWSGGVSILGGALVAGVQSALCERRVIRDWHNCLDDAGIGIH